MLSVLFITLVVCLLLSVPVGFSIGISTVAFVLSKGTVPLSIIPQRMVEGVDSFPLMALPLFILSGEVMAMSCTPRLMRFANMLIGRVPGGLGAAASLGCGFFGSISGSGVATTAAIGGVMAPEMVRKGYAPGFTASLIAGSGVLGMVIPPSFSMVVYGASGGVSIGNLFLGGFIPGVMAVMALAGYSMLVGLRRGYYHTGHSLGLAEKLRITLDALLPLFMPVIILGGVMTGAVTPTESGMIAVIYALLLEIFVYRAMTFKRLRAICVNSAITSAIIMFIMSAATPFGWIMATENIPKLFADGILAVTDNPHIIYLLIMCMLLALGTFMEGTSIIILVTPILLPVVASFGMDGVHFGIFLMLAIAIGGTTPPLAVNLFVSTRIVGIKVEDTFPDILFVIGIMTAVLLLTLYIPELSLYLPGLLGK